MLQPQRAVSKELKLGLTRQNTALDPTMGPAMRNMLFSGDGLAVPHKPCANPPLHSLLL